MTGVGDYIRSSLARICEGVEALHHASPDSADAVRVKHAIVADDGEILELGLRNQHPIEWIPMLAREPARTLSVQNRDIEAGEILGRH